ncbi:MAG: YebC/PmpR family DNA-binding transcriptional regulator, partial [Deltaproteobacteria bacterium]
MAGHNKWSKVKNIKGAVDAKRSKIFTKITKEIMVASRIGGGNPDTNARLRLAVQSAREASMPKDNIERAIKKGTGELGGDAIEEVTYEGYGPGGVAILVETTSDNKNRTVADLRSLFKSGGGNMGESGSVSWMFDRVGQLVFEPNTFSEEKIMDVALEVGAQ